MCVKLKEQDEMLSGTRHQDTHLNPHINVSLKAQLLLKNLPKMELPLKGKISHSNGVRTDSGRHARFRCSNCQSQLRRIC